jgi:hypothetical protein
MENSQRKIGAKVDNATSSSQEVIEATEEKTGQSGGGGGCDKKRPRKMKATVRASQEKVEAKISSIQSELEESIRTQVQDSMASVYQCTQHLCDELNANTAQV